MKKMTATQMNALIRTGDAWEHPSNVGDLGDLFVTDKYLYQWFPPQMCGDRMTEGAFVATDTA